MKKVIPSIVFLVILVFWGCKSDPKIEIIDFPVSKKVSLLETEIPNLLAMPQNILILSDNVIIYDAMTDWVFKIFSRENLVFKGQLIRRGRGPMEEVFVSHLFRSTGEDALLFQTASSVKVAKIQDHNFGFDLLVLNVHPLPANMLSDSDFFLLNDKVCSSISFLSPEKDFRCFDLNTDITFEWGEFLPMQRPATLPPDAIFYLAKYTTVHSDGSLLAVVYQNLPILRIYCTQSGQILHQLHMADSSKNEELLEKNFFETGFITYYWQLKSTSEYIYGLFPGAELSFEDENIPDFASELHVWKWDGTPVMTIELDRPIFSFDVTADNKQIIATSVVDVNKLFSAEIPWD
jgi:hypothetical protein